MLWYWGLFVTLADYSLSWLLHKLSVKSGFHYEGSEDELECLFYSRGVGASLVAQMVKNLPAMWKTQVQTLGQEDFLGKEMATPSNILA